MNPAVRIYEYAAQYPDDVPVLLNLCAVCGLSGVMAHLANFEEPATHRPGTQVATESS